MQEERCTSLYGVPTMFIAQLDHPSFGSYRSRHPAHGHHGGRAVPGRSDAAGRRPHAHAGGDDLLRHDRNLAGFISVIRRRSARALASPQSDRVHPHVESKIVDPQTGATVPRGRAGRAVHARILGDARLLERSRRDTPRPIDAARWMHTGDLARHATRTAT